jgi:hypothetical protein
MPVLSAAKGSMQGNAGVVAAVGQYDKGAPKDGQSRIITNGDGHTG